MIGFFACSKSSTNNLIAPVNNNSNLINVYFKATASNGKYELIAQQNKVDINGGIRPVILGGGIFNDTLNFTIKVAKGDSVFVTSKFAGKVIYIDTRLLFTISTDSIALASLNLSGSGLYNNWVYIK